MVLEWVIGLFGFGYLSCGLCRCLAGVSLSLIAVHVSVVCFVCVLWDRFPFFVVDSPERSCRRVV